VALLICAGAWAAPVTDTTLDDQEDIAVTVYNNGLGLVRDVRALNLGSGELELRFMGVAEQIRPETVGLRSLAKPGSVIILEQNYEYDLISPQKLMEKYVGKPVRLVNHHNDIGFSEVDATLLSTNGGPVYKVGGEIHLGHPGSVVLPEIPDNLIAKPSLIWQLNNRRADQKLEVTYLTNGLSWKADYVLTLAKDDQSLDVAGWVTLDNQSGATYTNAKLKLVAGEVNVVRRPQAVMLGAALEEEVADVAYDAMPVEESFAEYHLYTIPRRTTIKQNQAKQVALLAGSGVECKKIYEYRGQVHYYSDRYRPVGEERADVFLTFRNEKENGLGIPLPAGVMRIYQEDSEGMLQFAGEDSIEHMPKDEDIRLRMGQAFDVVAERKQTDFKRVTDRMTRSEFEITLRNHKEQDVVVDVVEPMPGTWKVVKFSHEYTKKDARTAIFSIPVPKDGEVILTYTMEVRW
jgi:hypothetical protein